MTLAETLLRGRLARSQVAVREPAGEAPAEPVARTRPEASAAGPRPGLRDWIGVLAMGIGLFMAIMDVQIVTSSLSQIWAIGQRRRDCLGADRVSNRRWTSTPPALRCNSSSICEKQVI